MSVSEIIIGLIGVILLLPGITGIRFCKNQWIINIMGVIGYRILISAIGLTFFILAVFTNVLYEG